MEVNKYRLAMRPKKFLTRDFLVYQDPSMQAARSEMQAGGIVQREGFSKGSSFKLNKNTAKKLKKTLPKGVGLSYNSKTNTWTIEGNISKNGKKVYREFISNPTEQQVLDFIDDYKIARKKILPNEITIGKFQELRFNDKYINLTNDEFAKVLNKKGFKTVQQYKPFTGDNVKRYQLNLGIANQVGKTSSPTRPMDEVKKIIKESPGGNIVLKEFKGNESYLRKYANSLVKQKKANLAYSFPLGNTKEQIMWKNFYNSSQRGDRITIGGMFNGKDLSDPTNWPRDKDGKINWQLKDKDGVQAWKNMTFTDNQAPNKPKTFYWNSKQGDLKNQIDNTFGKGFFERNTRAYDQQALGRKQTITIDGKPKNINQFIAEQMIIKNFQAIPGNENKIPSKEYINSRIKNYNFQEAHHPEGVGKNPYKVELASRDANRKLGLLEAQRVRGVITDNEFKKQAQAISDEFGGIRYKVGSKYVGKKGTPQTILTSIQNQFTNNPETMRAVIRSFSPDPKCQIPGKAEGGRVSFQAGSDICYQQGLKEIEKAKTNPTVKSRLASKIGDVTKTVGKGLRFLELPLEAAIEGLLVGDAMLRGQSFERAVKGRTLLLRAFMPGGYSSSFDEQTLKEIGEFSPAAKSYYDSKTRSDKYKELQTKLENAKKLTDSETAFVDQDYVNSTINSAQKEFDDFVRDNASYFRLDEEILKPGGYYAQQADEAANKFFFDEARESVYGKMREGIETTGEDTMVPGLDTYTLPTDIERAKTKVQPFENVEALNLPPTAMEFEQSITPDEKTAMKNFIKQTRPGISDEEAELLTTIVMSEQYKNISTPFPGIERLGFAGGGLSRRGFLKLMAGIAATVGAVKSGIIKLATPAAKKVLKDAPTGTPDWFAPLVDKIMKEGVDAGETMKIRSANRRSRRSANG